jgi:hypothetical protein
MCAYQNQEPSNHLFATCTTTKTLTNDIINRSMQLGGNTVRDKWDRHAKGTNRAHGQQWYGHVMEGVQQTNFSRPKEELAGIGH